MQASGAQVRRDSRLSPRESECLYSDCSVEKSALEDIYDSPRNVKPILPADLDQLQLHGTTTLAFVVGDCIIVAVDSMASVGSYVGSRTVKKVFRMSPQIIATMAGGAADCAFWIRNVASRMRILEHSVGVSALPVSAYARALAAALRPYRGAGLSLGSMVAGWHPQSGPKRTLCILLLDLPNVVIM